MVSFLVENPFLTLFVVIALGALLGLVPFGPVRLGAAGALFVGLAVGALDNRIGPAQTVALSTVGLAVWAYAIGLEAGPVFFREVGRQLPVMIGSIICLGLTAVAVVRIGAVVGIDSSFLAGGYAGIGTTTPGLAAATAATNGSKGPAVGYAIGYPLAVILAIVFVAVLAALPRWTSKRDNAAPPPATLVTRTVDVGRATTLSALPLVAAGRLLVSAYEPADGGGVRVAHGLETVRPGDRVVLVGGPDEVAEGARQLGEFSATHLLDDRSVIDYRRILLTNPRLSGRTVADLALDERYGGLITRIRRGDIDMIATADLVLQLDDQLRVLAPRDRIGALSAHLGDRPSQVSEVSMVALGTGLALGFLIGIPQLHIGNSTLALGSAAGPLVMGMILGWRRRTGKLVWTLPTRANLTLRQFGLMLFLGIVGLTSGYAFRTSAFSVFGLKLLLVLLSCALISYILFIALCKALGISRERSMGLLSGYVGNPAITAYANSRANDNRINAGYATLFALAVMAKIVFIQLIVGS